MTRPQDTTTSSWLQYRPRYRPDIEGLRAVAVLIVVLFHAKVPGFEGGFVGVDVFFVLSGYLITWLLVNEAEQKGAVDMARFYARRARRLLPAMAVVLLVTLAVTALLYSPLEQRTLARTWATTALYVSNVDFASRTMDYHGADAEANPLLHTWSLSVEEQFYLVWPWLVILGLGVAGWQRRKSPPSPKRLFVALSVVTALSFALSLYLTARQAGWAFYLSPTRAWEFGAGGLAVLVPVNRWPRRRLNPARPSAATAVMSWVALGGLALATVFFDSQTPFPGVAALLPVLSTIVLLRAGSPDYPEGSGALNRLLALPPLQSIGKLSYSWYLWHWPALVFAAALVDPLGPLGRAAAIAVSLALAYASYRLVENPLRHHRLLAARPIRSFAMAATVSVATVALAALWWDSSVEWSTTGTQAKLQRIRSEMPLIYEDDCDRFGKADLTKCVYGDSTASRTAVLVGDSHAGQWFPALHEATESAGWQLVVLTLSACPMVEVPALYHHVLERTYSECPEWRQSAIDEIQNMAPDVTFISSSSDYDVPVATWEAQARPVLSAVSRYSKRTVLIADTPPAGINIPACLARAEWRPGTLIDPVCKPRGNPIVQARAEAQTRAARSTPRVEVLDVRDDVCVVGECEATAGDRVRYRDSGHLSLEFASTFSDHFNDYLAVGPAPAGGQVQADSLRPPTPRLQAGAGI